MQQTLQQTPYAALARIYHVTIDTKQNNGRFGTFVDFRC